MTLSGGGLSLHDAARAMGVTQPAQRAPTAWTGRTPTAQPGRTHQIAAPAPAQAAQEESTAR